MGNFGSLTVPDTSDTQADAIDDAAFAPVRANEEAVAQAVDEPEPEPVLQPEPEIVSQQEPDDLQGGSLDDLLNNLDDAPLDPQGLQIELPIENSYHASQVDPDQVAADKKLAKELGLPETAIDDDSRQDFTQQSIQRSMDQGVQDAPITRSLLEDDVGLAKQVSDDLPNLTTFEKTARKLRFTEAASAIIDNLQALGYRFVEATGEAIGSEGLEAFGQTGAEANLAEAAATTAGRGTKFVDIHTVSDFFQWAKENAPHVMSSLPTLAGVAVGGAIGTATPIPGGAGIGMLVGGFFPSFVLGVGQSQQAIKEKDSGVEAPAIAFGSGALIAAMDTALPFKVGSMVRNALGVKVGEKVLQITAARLAQRFGTGVVGGGSVEGITEVIQDTIAEVAAAHATDKDIDWKEFSNNLIESFAVGALTGGAIGGVASPTTDLIKANKQKQLQQALNINSKESKLKQRAIDTHAEATGLHLEGGGADRIFVSVEGILAFAGQHPEGTMAGLDQLGISSALDAASLADLNGDAPNSFVSIPAEVYSRHVLGSDGFNVIQNHIKVDPEAKTFHEAAQALFSDEQITEQLEAELDQYDAATELKGRVLAAVNRMDKDSVTQILSDAPSDVMSIFTDLMQRVADNKISTEGIEKQGRIDRLSEQATKADAEIVKTEAQLDAAEAEGRGTITIQKRLDKLTQARDKVVGELDTLTTDESIQTDTGSRLPVDPEVVAAEETLNANLETLKAEKASLDEDLARAKQGTDKTLQNRIKRARTKKNKEIAEAEKEIKSNERKFNTGNRKLTLKAKTLRNLEVKIDKAMVRAARDAFRAGKKAIGTIISRGNKLAATVKGIKGLTTEQKAALGSRLKGKQTEAALAKAIASVEAKIPVLVETNRVKQITAALKKVLKQNKTKRVDGTPKGKMTPEIHSMVDGLPALLNMSQENAQAELLVRSLGSPDENGGDPSPSQVSSALVAIENSVLEAVAFPERANADTLENILFSLNEVIAEGKAIGRGNALAKAMKQDRIKSDFRDAVDLVEKEVPQFLENGDPKLDENGEQEIVKVRRSTTGKLGKVSESFRNIETAMLAWSGAWWNKLGRIMATPDREKADALLEALSLTDEATAYTTGKQEMTTELMTKLSEATGLSETAVLTQLQKDEVEKINLGFFTDTALDSRELTMTRSELRHRAMAMMNDQLKTQMAHPKGDAYSLAMFDAIETELNPTDRKLMAAQLDFYNEYYNRINTAYEKAYGVSLEKIETYVPIRRETTDGLDEFMQSILFQGNVKNGSLKERTGAITPLKIQSDMAVMQSHIMEMEYFRAYHDKVSLINSVFDAKTKSIITKLYGENMTRTLTNDITYFSRKGVLSSLTAESFFVGLMRNFSIAQLAVKPQIMLKQLSSFAAFSADVNPVVFSANLLRFAANPRKALRILNQSEYFRNRGIDIDKDFQDITSDKFGGTFLNFLGRNPRFTRAMMINVRFGDKTAIAAGGYAHYLAMVSKLKKQGVSEAEAKTKALKSFERIAANTQQSSNPDQLSEMQRSGAFQRILVQFMSSANALARAEYSAMVEKSRGRISNAEFVKLITIHHVIIPNLIQFIANGFSFDDDDQMRATMFGAFNGLFVVGDVIEAVINTVTDAETIFDPATRHPLKVFTDLIKSVDKIEDFELSDILEGGNEVDRAIKAASGFSGIPAATLLNMMRGMDLTGSGDVEEGVLLMLGYSPYTIDKRK